VVRPFCAAPMLEKIPHSNQVAAKTAAYGAYDQATKAWTMLEPIISWIMLMLRY
jgi:hypothetical protein